MSTVSPPAEAKPTIREQRKAARRLELLDAAAELFAERGYAAVRLEDLGAAVGISGPAVYRHFPNKEAVLVELLVDISDYLLTGGRRVVRNTADASGTISELVDFHLDFALSKPALIRIQDPDLANLPTSARRDVRRKQREYVEIWVGALRGSDPTLHEDDARTKAHAVFGLLNSTPHSIGRSMSRRSRDVLREMANAALGA